MSKITQLFGIKPNVNHQVHDILEKAKQDFALGKYGPSTKCMVVILNPDNNQVLYETCGLHLIEAVGILEIAKTALIKGN